MNKFYSFLLILTLIAGFHFKVLSIDPLSLVVIGMLLWNNVVNLKRQQELADLITKAHGVNAANQKTVLKMIENVRAELRRK